MASKGRNGDSMLVHMTPGEVAGLHALALKHGGSLTINPDTGLPEAGFLKSLLPMLAGFALGPAGFGLVSSAMGAGAIVGGITGLATGSLSKGLMAGLGAYGGFGIGESLAGLGAGELAQGQISANMPTLAQGATEAQVADYAKQVNDLRTAGLQGANQLPLADKLSAGFSSATASPTDALAFAKNNFKPLAAAAVPIMADMMVPTTTKAPTPTDTGYIRQKIWDGRQFVDVGPVKASDWGSRNFSDVFTGRNYSAKDGGIVALANGGMPGYAGATDGSVVGAGATAPISAADAQKLVEAQYATIGRSGTGAGTNQIDEAGLKAWTEDLTSGRVSANDFGNRFQTAVTNYMAERPDDQYTQYVKEYQAKQANTGGGGVANLATTGNAATTGADTSGIATLNNTGAATGTTGTNLNAFNNSFTGANINDYIANNNLDATGIAAAAKQFNVNPADITAAQNAQNIVTNVYRNVLGRDPDPAGLSWWTNQIMNGDRTGAEMYAEFQKSAKSILGTAGTKELFKEMSLADATKDFTGYQSADKRTIADEWVRNTLGREVTEDDRKQQWYKDASNSSVMNTVGKAEDIYSKFKNFAYENSGDTVKQKIAEAKATISKNGLTEADVLRQTGKTIAELVGSGMNLENDLFKASQLRKPGDKAGFDFNTITKAKPVINNTFDSSTEVDRQITNPYGNKTNPGDLTYNTDGTVTVQPNLPYRPYGGFSGMGEVRDAYTRGGGSLGYTSYAPKTMEEFEAKYGSRVSGDSKAALDYLTGKAGAKYPTKSGVGQISKPYDEEVMGYPARTNVPYTYDKASGKMVANPDYVAPSRDAKGNVNYTLSTNEIKKYLSDTPLSGQALYEWAQTNGVSAQQIADSTGRKLSDVYAEFRAAKKATDDKIGTGVGASGTYDIGGGGTGGGGDSGASSSSDSSSSSGDGGIGTGADTAKRGGLMQGYAMGGYALGGLGTLGGYSDGGRLLKGPGDGVSDSIPATIGRKQQPARLADGEFVVPARIVSELGNGSTDAGAKKLYAMMDRVQRARGKTTGKNKVAANSRADKYLPA
jgi:hypothetical protein